MPPKKKMKKKSWPKPKKCQHKVIKKWLDKYLCDGCGVEFRPVPEIEEGSIPSGEIDRAADLEDYKRSGRKGRMKPGIEHDAEDVVPEDD